MTSANNEHDDGRQDDERAQRRLHDTIAKAIAGSELAFTALYQRYASNILFHVRDQINYPEDAEDVAQEVVIQMFRTIGQLQSPYAFHKWLQSIIVHVCNNYNNRVGRKKDQETVLEMAENLEDIEGQIRLEEGQDEEIEASAQKALLYEEITKLPEAQRRCIVMHYFDELSYKEIAEILSVGVSTVSSNIVKAKKHMRESIAARQQEAGPSAGVKSKPVTPPTGAAALLPTGPAIAASLRYGLKQTVSLEQVERLCAQVAPKIKALSSTRPPAPADAARQAGSRQVARWLVPLVLALVLVAGAGTVAWKYFYGDRPDGAPQHQMSYTPQATIEITGTAQAPAVAGGSVMGGVADTQKSSAQITLKLDGEGGTAQSWVLRNAETGAECAAGTGTVVRDELSGLKPGNYTISWQLLNADNIPGTVSRTFSVQ